jgi:cardiolipin synthase
MTPNQSLFYLIAWILTSSWFTARILLERREPASTISWLFTVNVFPYVGPLLYLTFGRQRLARTAQKRSAEISAALGGHEVDTSKLTSEAVETLNALYPQETAVVKIAGKASHYLPTQNNKVEIIDDPEVALREMKSAIDQANTFVHLEYYIINSDEVTDQLFSSLEAALDRGVRVRIMYDALGSLFLKKRTFIKLVKKGAKVAGFHPFRFFSLRFNVNFRNHRKILLVDDNIAFTGGTNIGKEYLGSLSPTQWLDYTVKVEGPVTRQLQDVFCGDWHFTTEEELPVSTSPISGNTGDAVIQVLESGPDTEFKSIYQAIFSAINQAKKEILLTTPYFIPDPAINTALQVAAMQGIKVQIILPQKNDAPMVQRASRSFYEDLLSCGVQIYEYIPRVLHAKMMIIDEKMTFLGSANMDIRSFRLNFELNLLIFGPGTAIQAKDFFMKDLSMSQRIDLDAHRSRPIHTKLAENACRILSPIF